MACRAALVGVAVAGRQVLLHIVPGSGAYGSALCFRGIHRFAAWLLIAVTLATALNSFALCGPVECADDPQAIGSRRSCRNRL